MAEQLDQLVLFPPTEAGERRNNIIVRLGGYLRDKTSESRTRKGFATELLKIVHGQSLDSELGKRELGKSRVYQMERDDFKGNVFPSSENFESPTKIMADAVVVGIAWRNPTSPFIEKLLHILVMMSTVRYRIPVVPEMWLDLSADDYPIYSQRLNGVVRQLSKYLEDERFRELSRWRCASKVLRMARGQDVESDEIVPMPLFVHEADFKENPEVERGSIPEFENIDPGGLLIDAVAAGFAWRNPMSPRVEELVMILVELKENKKQFFTRGVDICLQETASRWDQLILRSITKDAEERGHEVDAGRRLQLAKHMFFARLYAKSLVDIDDHSMISELWNTITSESLDFMGSRDLCIKICSSCIELDRTQMRVEWDEIQDQYRVGFLCKWYQFCETEFGNPRETWEVWRERIRNIPTNDAATLADILSIESIMGVS
ncbi:hypothetical protein PGQ11_009715 [Apiospora arundinis]|uniref:Uncharacterized protein n=1 Tax=Apiospora arundinis TaxID=335852 RepID=A0ABR2I7C5_9PEZI